MQLPKKTAAITSHLTVVSVDKALRFYEKAFGFAVKLMLPGGSGKIVHAEMTYADCTVMIGPESPDRGMRAPITSGVVSPVSLYLYVDDVDAQHAKAVAAGGKELLPPSDQFFGARTSMLMDPDGHQWMLSQHKKDMTMDSMKEALKAARAEIRHARGEPEASAAGRHAPAREASSAGRPAPQREASSAGRPAPPREGSSAGRPAPPREASTAGRPAPPREGSSAGRPSPGTPERSQAGQPPPGRGKPPPR